MKRQKHVVSNDEIAAFNKAREEKFGTEEETIAEAIKILKNAGYKVLKPITQYEEI